MKPAFLCLVLLGVCAANAADWPTWRGPNRDGVSSETGLLTEWPAAGPKKRWTATEAGLGYSSFAVVGNRLYTMGADETNEYLIAFDATSGKKIWEVSVGERLQNNWGDGPRSTPAVSGNMIVALGGRGDLVCVSAQEGSLKWSADMESLGGKTPNWGYAESPFIDGSTVLCTPGRDAGTVVAFDLQSGKKLWQSSDITERAHYSSIIAADHYGQNQYIQLTKEKVFGLDSKGKL
ncbi:MAG: PQQ-binding-like beta-propeller repeat protein, partial [Fuerstiella sp.]